MKRPMHYGRAKPIDVYILRKRANLHRNLERHVKVIADARRERDDRTPSGVKMEKNANQACALVQGRDEDK